jgi:hypothetical protein
VKRSSFFKSKVLKLPFYTRLFMAENPNEQLNNPPAFDPRIQTENLAFDAKELVGCSGCGRLNPPNRLNCVYCGHELEIKDENAAPIKPHLRKLELWERGWNVIVHAADAQVDAGKIALLLSMEADDLNSILVAGTPLPLARVESENEAAILSTRLERFGLQCRTVSDADLGGERPPVRLAGIDIRDGRIALKHFNTGFVAMIDYDDLAVIVPGLIAGSRIDTIEKKGRRGKKKLLDQTATTSDESILDIYSRDDEIGFRVHLAGFDFSCLGDDMGLLATENLRRLIDVLKESAPNARVVNNYASVRHALGIVWELESRKDPQGLQRSGFGKRDFGTVISSSNLNQFTKYSRLQRHLL